MRPLPAILCQAAATRKFATEPDGELAAAERPAFLEVKVADVVKLIRAVALLRVVSVCPGSKRVVGVV